MPISMQDREQGFEAKFAHDEEVRFLARARRDKLFAHWAAEELELSEAETEALVKAVVAIPDGPRHEKALLAYIGERLRGRAAGSEQSLATALARCTQQARQQLELPPDHSDTA
ncbi:MAG: ATPase inhibitor subunit zeta [Rhodopila sp.]